MSDSLFSRTREAALLYRADVIPLDLTLALGLDPQSRRAQLSVAPYRHTLLLDEVMIGSDTGHPMLPEATKMSTILTVDGENDHVTEWTMDCPDSWSVEDGPEPLTSEGRHQVLARIWAALGQVGAQCEPVTV